MAPGSGFWPSGSWLKQVYWPYVEQCKAAGKDPLSAEVIYSKEEAQDGEER